MAADFQTILSSPSRAYAEGLEFFRGKGMLNDALKKLAADLEKNGIDYAVIGSSPLINMASSDLRWIFDLLLTQEGLDAFHEKLVGPAYPAGARKKFRTTGENVPVDVITAGEYPGDGLPKPVQFPNPDDFSVVIDGIKTLSLEKLVELKLSSGISAPDRLKDLADVQELIKIKDLDEDFAEKLDEYVRPKYLELGGAVWSAPKRDQEGD